MSDLDNVYNAHGEICSHASANRKNCHQISQGITCLSRKKIGCRSDLIIRKNRHEYECSEAGRFYKRMNDMKILKERELKYPKIMKDIFVDLCSAVGWETERIRQIEVIG